MVIAAQEKSNNIVRKLTSRNENNAMTGLQDGWKIQETWDQNERLTFSKYSFLPIG